MAYVGDLVPKAGIYTNQGVIVQKNDDGTVVIDTEPMTVHKYHKFANTTGLTLEEKQKFNELLDEIYKTEDDVQKINDIQINIDSLQTNPKNHRLVQYLRNQQAHLIRTAKKLPRTFQWDEAKLNLYAPGNVDNQTSTISSTGKD